MTRFFLAFLIGLFFILPIASIVPTQQALATSAPTAITIYNPLDNGDGHGDDVRYLLGRAIKGILSIVGSLALLMFVYGGVLWLTSAGNPDFVKKGKSVIVWAVLGLGVIFSAYAVVSAIFNGLTKGSVGG